MTTRTRRPAAITPAARAIERGNGAAAPVAAASRPGLLDGVGYWLTIGALYSIQVALFYFPAKGKIFDDWLVAPPPIKEQFDGSLIAAFPGTSVAWAILGFLQAAVVVAVVVSLARGEWRPDRTKPLLTAALGLVLVTFALLLFGSSMTSQYESVASLFTYFGVTAGLLVLVRLLAPGRVNR